ncbi:DNA-formamidopyrimidine glycosylase family protein [Jatrophihabitans lederbergiae]|uniref:DNA-formamidopyrimidine glycosylase family protein n=1 Tax=Jatrophihabitans lederbergiae TaxID=3075547 RepID=A0ABU2JB32_9ACTN|nr:DNA-formamidopyrimidine glycosylase family protein [Jatrophihabitans sp. DSM 44399]MDT0262202.1 DNA-formamidopyrimidine glycosylase family protein [Jatrophihabitans sp. DSM 44399]
MPELPEIEALAAFLREHATGRVVIRSDVAAINAVKTFDPPLSALNGLTVTGASRHGKFLDVDIDGLHLITHLSRGGWLQWRDKMSPVPPKPGRGPLAFRLHLTPLPDALDGEPDAGFDLTEAGTQKRLAVYLVRDPMEVPGIAALGPDAMRVDLESFAALLAGENRQLKGVLTHQSVLAGIGNAYSDEILHAARLSPFAIASRLTEFQVSDLYSAMRATLTDAVDRSVGQRAATLKSEKRSGLAVHARTGLPCPVCGDTVREVSFADKSLQYCPTCQTGGKNLADRRLSRLVK